ncbi:hypothetical protein DFH06DRAFT_1163081 [Mycena polygramma]|nr:hypothetical protein DFH06DRAFT_1163081 [Mycena polygramma]
MYTVPVLMTALIAVSSVSAVSLSSACQSALTQIAVNPDANACLSSSSLASLALATNDSSIITPVDNWLKSMCALPPCSNSTLSAVVTNITTGCSAELSASGSSGATASTILPLVEQYYATVRKVVCLTDSGTNCITQTLTNIQSMLGTLSIGNIGGVIGNAITSNASLPANISCSNCVKEAYNVLNGDFPSTAASLSSDLNSECGSSFTDGTTPTGIVETATTSGAAKDNSAKAMLMTPGALAGLSASVLVVASSLWAFLA